MKKRELIFCTTEICGVSDYSAVESDSRKVVICFDKLPEDDCKKIISGLNGNALDGYKFELVKEKSSPKILDVIRVNDTNEIIVLKKGYVKKLMDLNKES